MLCEMAGFCSKPDRDNPELVCGYPLPCPWHTVQIDLASDPPTITVPATEAKDLNPDALAKLKRIANVLKEEADD